MSSRLNYGKTFLLGFGFFGVSVIWGVYNAFVPVFLVSSQKLGESHSTPRTTEVEFTSAFGHQNGHWRNLIGSGNTITNISIETDA